ncbi:hypothetical protein ABK040_002070 [Willaertia magna]
MSNSKITDNMIFAGSASRFKGLVMEPVNKDGYCDFEFQTTEKNLKIKKIISGGAYRYIYNCLWTEDNKIYFQHSNPEYAYGLPLFCYLKQYFTILDKNDENFYEINFNQILLDFNNIVNIEIKDIIGNANGLFIWLNNNYLFYLNLNENNIKQIESEQSKIITAFGTGNMSSRYIFKDDKRNTLYWDDSSLQKVEINESETDKNEPILFGCCYDNNNIIVTMENKLYCKKYDTELFQYKASKFEKESKVIDLKCGYDHTVFLLVVFLKMKVTF